MQHKHSRGTFATNSNGFAVHSSRGGENLPKTATNSSSVANSQEFAKNLPSQANTADLSSRREFLKNSAKLTAGVVLFGGVSIFTSKARAASQNVVNSALGEKIAAAMPSFTLNNGIKMPAAGFGTLKLGDMKQTQKAVEQALEAGYRLFDTAQSYANEEGVGAALKATGVKRDELFITCKLFRPYANEAMAGKAYFESLKKLKIDYADLYLIHQPVNDTYGAWRAMSKLYKDKAVRAIGVSNFNPARIMDFVQNNEITPAVNQIECHPHFQQEFALQNLKELGIQMEAFSPLKQTRDGILTDKTLTKIAKAHKKTVAQVILRWVYQRGIVSIAKTSKPERMRENLAIFDFELTAADMAQIAKLETNKPLLDHQDPQRIKWFNERTAGESLKR